MIASKERRRTEELQKVGRRGKEGEKKRDEARDRWSEQKHDWSHPPGGYRSHGNSLVSKEHRNINGMTGDL